MELRRGALVQPLKRRRVTVEDIERGLLRLRLSCGAATVDPVWGRADGTKGPLPGVATGPPPTDAFGSADCFLVAAAEAAAAAAAVAAGENAPCTAIVPFHWAPTRRRNVRPRAAALAAAGGRTGSGPGAAARIAVDSYGTAFVLGGGAAARPPLGYAEQQQPVGKRPACFIDAHVAGLSVVYQELEPLATNILPLKMTYSPLIGHDITKYLPELHCDSSW